jgi:deazaflavin-dependent oxidoreductase (nitroreductase family)
MVKKIKDIQPPRGFARLLWRAPIFLYQVGLGGLLGERFLLLNHTGRKSGSPRQAVLEVVSHHPETGAYIVASGFGKKADWYQNVIAKPEVSIQVGKRTLKVQATELSAAQAVEVLLDYNRRHPAALRTLAGILGYQTDGSLADVHFFATVIPIVSFTPLGR